MTIRPLPWDDHARLRVAVSANCSHAAASTAAVNFRASFLSAPIHRVPNFQQQKHDRGQYNPPQRCLLKVWNPPQAQFRLTHSGCATAIKPINPCGCHPLSTSCGVAPPACALPGVLAADGQSRHATLESANGGLRTGEDLGLFSIRGLQL